MLKLFPYFAIALKLSNVHGDSYFLSYIETIETLYDLKIISCRLSILEFLKLHHFRCGRYNTVKYIINIY